jgi:hypothetical protein
METISSVDKKLDDPFDALTSIMSIRMIKIPLSEFVKEKIVVASEGKLKKYKE